MRVIIRAAQGEAGIKVVVGGHPRQGLHSAQRVVRQHARQVLGVAAGEGELRRAVGANGFERARRDLDGLRVAQRGGAEDDFEFLAFRPGERELLRTGR